MFITCLDLEGPLVPEIWIEFAKARNIEELKITTRDEPDYRKLMALRINILKRYGLKLKDIQETISLLSPKPGAKEFLDEVRSFSQTVIISDTFVEFAMPLMKQLGYPTIMCNSLVVDEDGTIQDIKMRLPGDAKLSTVKAFHSIGFDTIAAGDSYNDIGMIEASKAGFLFKSTDKITGEHPHIKAYTEYDELLAAIKEAEGIK
ncbi:MAG: bifunctional phosphoserine phosphatase/homoserine phosphotransferase ThrH [Clostridiales bacterium]|nr:bifunctional phosphoserine phosphatase/homoserine phosphotransferase ThrH [Clostridiales bacterium]MBS5878364.1 bifunctional phosphoserine phosphatase/homoserine phosphotransferase ThrH [Clostridiales bacterium]MDU0939852.1 bifunctional phosphoserine phosphatase/homoserine phosphotransferase ThrH [Clostridiales bacterium]MDU1042696.1 bifunctional phosphoserine phosphatase/homoserine phosphotransferase ThrH [Clostridiales bacterium]MDU3489527.1 bifunctional phosphoserine phosphatase/homoserin